MARVFRLQLDQQITCSNTCQSASPFCNNGYLLMPATLFLLNDVVTDSSFDCFYIIITLIIESLSYIRTSNPHRASQLIKDNDFFLDSLYEILQCRISECAAHDMKRNDFHSLLFEFFLGCRLLVNADRIQRELREQQRQTRTESQVKYDKP